MKSSSATRNHLPNQIVPNQTVPNQTVPVWTADPFPIRNSRTEDIKNRKNPTSRAGAREGGSLSNDLDGYQPSAETVAWASQKYGLDASDLERINAFQDHWRAKGEIPRNLDAAYHKWIRKEHEFAQRDQHQRRQNEHENRPFGSKRGSAIQALLDDLDEEQNIIIDLNPQDYHG